MSGSWSIKGTDESMTRVDSSVLLMHHDPDRSWITDPDPDHPKVTHLRVLCTRKRRREDQKNSYDVLVAQRVSKRMNRRD